MKCLKNKSPQTSDILSVIFNNDYTADNKSQYYHQRYTDIMNSPREEILNMAARRGSTTFKSPCRVGNVMNKRREMMIRDRCISKFLLCFGCYFNIIDAVGQLRVKTHHF